MSENQEEIRLTGAKLSEQKLPDRCPWKTSDPPPRAKQQGLD